LNFIRGVWLLFSQKRLRKVFIFVPMVGIINYGMGNLHSIQRKMQLLNAEFKIIEHSEDIPNCDQLILPGVGHFGKAMQKLEEKSLIHALHKFVKNEQKPILGICLGMQLMTSFSEEGNTEGLGWVNTKIVRFNPTNFSTVKVPHIGWNSVVSENSKLLDNLEKEFYFVHSYYSEIPKEKEVVLHFTTYERRFVSGFEKKNIFGVQYHPEKSHDQGLEVLRNFLELT